MEKHAVCSWIGTLNIVCQFSLDWYTGLMQFLSKSQQDFFFVGIDKIILKCTWKGKPEGKTILIRE